MLNDVHNINLPSEPLTPASLQVAPLPTASKLLLVVGDPARWAILRELADGKTLSVQELAERIQRSPNQTSKHLTLLRSVNAVTAVELSGHDGRKQFHIVAEEHRRTGPDGRPEIDYGSCVLRF